MDLYFGWSEGTWVEPVELLFSMYGESHLLGFSVSKTGLLVVVELKIYSY